MNSPFAVKSVGGGRLIIAFIHCCYHVFEFSQSVNTKINEVKEDISVKMSSVNTRLALIENEALHRSDAIDKLNKNIETLTGVIDKLDGSLDEMDDRADDHEHRLDTLESGH